MDPELLLVVRIVLAGVLCWAVIDGTKALWHILID